MIEYQKKSKLDTELRQKLYDVVKRTGVALPRLMTPSQFFHHASVEFHVQTEREHGTGEIRPVSTVCIFENKGRRTIGVARLGYVPNSLVITFDEPIPYFPTIKRVLENWNDEVGQGLAFSRAIRTYLTDTPLPIKVGEKNEYGIERNQDGINMLFADLGHDEGSLTDDNEKEVQPSPSKFKDMMASGNEAKV